MKDFSVWPPQGGEKEDDPKVFFFPGWGCSTAAEYAPFLGSVAKWMRQAVYAVHFGSKVDLSGIAEFRNAIKPLPKAFHPVQIAKAATCYRVAKEWGLGGYFTIVGYSEGAMHAVLVAEALRAVPHALLSQVILVNPAGITGVEGRTRILLRAAVNGFQKIGPFISGRGREGLLAHMRSVAAYKKNFPGAGGAEGMTPGLVDLSGRLIYLREQGVDVHIITTENDAMVPPHAIEMRFWPELIPVHVIPGTHFSIFTHPERIAQAILEVMNK